MRVFHSLLLVLRAFLLEIGGTFFPSDMIRSVENTLFVFHISLFRGRTSMYEPFNFLVLYIADTSRSY